MRLLGAVLLLEGAALLLLEALPPEAVPAPLASFQPDPLHNLIHVAWGLALLAIPLASRRASAEALVALAFGVFYVCLAVLGILVHNPFGLRLGPGENAFHSLVGPLTLAVGAWLWTHPDAGAPRPGHA